MKVTYFILRNHLIIARSLGCGTLLEISRRLLPAVVGRRRNWSFGTDVEEGCNTELSCDPIRRSRISPYVFLFRRLWTPWIIRFQLPTLVRLERVSCPFRSSITALDTPERHTEGTAPSNVDTLKRLRAIRKGHFLSETFAPSVMRYGAMGFSYVVWVVSRGCLV